MKRSDMVDKIEDLLVTPMVEGFCPSGEDILDIVESLGMLPPENPNLSQHVIDNGLNGNYWESEDE